MFYFVSIIGKMELEFIGQYPSSLIGGGGELSGALSLQHGTTKAMEE